MHAWESIQKTLDFIEANIGVEIEIEKLAKQAALSPFYYQRLFSRLVKKPVREYIKKRRLAHACRSIGDMDNRILDIALDCGFGSHETFTRAFKEAYGMTPEAYRKRPVMLNQFDKPDLLLNYVMIDEGVPLITDGLVLEFNRKTIERSMLFAGLSGQVSIDEQLPLGKATGVDVPGEIWGKFHKEKHRISRIAGGRGIGVGHSFDPRKRQFTYFVGEEVERSFEDARFEIWELPAGEYIVCGFEAENFDQLTTVALNKAIKYSGVWMKAHNLPMEGDLSEVYYDSSPEGAYMELWIPVHTTKGEKNMDKILETVIIEGAEFTIVEKPATIYAGFRTVASDEEGEPEPAGYTRFQEQKGKIEGSLTPNTMVCLSIHYKEHNHGHKVKRALMHCREVSSREQPAGIDVVESPACIIIRAKADEAAWALTKKLTGEENPKWHMAPLFGLTEKLFCNTQRGYEPTPDFSDTYEIEYYNDDGIHYTGLSVRRR